MIQIEYLPSPRTALYSTRPATVLLEFSQTRPTDLGNVRLFPSAVRRFEILEPTAVVPRLEASNDVEEVEAEPTFEELRDAGRRAVDAGDLRGALELFDRALLLVRDTGDTEKIDLAVCNRSAALLGLGEHESVVADLREVLVRSGNARNGFLAAYHAAHAFEFDRSFKKALFYGRIARDRAQAQGRPEWLSSSHNLIGNCLAGDSYFAEAEEAYRTALDHLPDVPSVRRASVTANLGYCRMMQDDVEGGLSLSLRGLRELSRFEVAPAEVITRADLCYGYLELDRVDRARRHIERAAELLDAAPNPTTRKNVLFLLGEVARTEGRVDEAYTYFTGLQTYFPDTPQVAELMTAVSMRQLVNLRA